MTVLRISDKDLFGLAQRMGMALQQAGLRLTVAESCTGGWLAKVVTDVPGSSNWFERGFIAYTNLSKQEMLGVSDTTLVQHGAVSESTAREMVSGLLQKSPADIAVSISGVAGPGGGSIEKPVGMVCFSWGKRREEPASTTEYFKGDRDEVRRQAVAHALNGVLDAVAT